MDCHAPPAFRRGCQHERNARCGLPGARVIDWMVPDPIGQSESYYRTVATQIEGLVMRLILELRTAK